MLEVLASLVELLDCRRGATVDFAETKQLLVLFTSVFSFSDCYSSGALRNFVRRVATFFYAATS